MKVIVDPVDLRRFAAVLEQEMQSLRERQKAVEAARAELAQTWRDARYQSFERTYVPTMRVVDQFQKSAERYAAYLRTKASRADAYLGRR